jgi:hypothetical protein
VIVFSRSDEINGEVSGHGRDFGGMAIQQSELVAFEDGVERPMKLVFDRQ